MTKIKIKTKKPDPKPLFPLKREWTDALDNFIFQTLKLRQMTEQALRLDLIKEPAKSMLREQLDKIAEATDDKRLPR